MGERVSGERVSGGVLTKATSGVVVGSDAGSSVFLEVVEEELARDENSGEVESMYEALLLIVNSVSRLRAERALAVDVRDVLEATGSMLLGWGLEEAARQWTSDWAPDAALASAFTQICHENGYKVVGHTLVAS